MTFTQIKYFLDVADCMNVTRAAQQNYVAQQVVSKQLQRLESELGYPLLPGAGPAYPV